MSSFRTGGVDELDKVVDFVVLGCDLGLVTFDLFFVSLAFLAFLLELELECFQFKGQFFVF